MKDINEIVKTANERKASDIHIAMGSPVKLRIDGLLKNLDDEILAFEDCEDIGEYLAGKKFIDIADGGELDLAHSFDGVRCRLNIFRAKGAVSVSIRLLSNKIPELSSLGLPPAVNTFSSYNKGIILVTGETGSGKSTTMASILNEINHSKEMHIITLEDPIEYVYESDKSLINQRQVGVDTLCYADGLRAILREDPNVILIGEMRDPETIETALTAAETGHLVFATLHTNSAADSVDRIVGVFPAEKHQQVRIQLASTLKAVLSQQLLRRKDGKGRVAACECMIVNSAIKNQIKEGNTAQIQSSLLASSALGSITMDNCLIDFVKKDIITPETAVEAAFNSDYVKQSIGFRNNSFGTKGVKMTW